MRFFKKSEESQPDAIIEELREKIAAAHMPAHAKKIADKELELLGRISAATSEYTIGLTYIEYLVSMPWNTKTDDNLDLVRVEKILNEDHYGLDKIKDRILEHLAVKKLRMSRKPRILIVDDEEVARKI